jgi:hypothetical protein
VGSVVLDTEEITTNLTKYSTPNPNCPCFNMGSCFLTDIAHAVRVNMKNKKPFRNFLNGFNFYNR